jgi:hypothetical protein
VVKRYTERAKTAYEHAWEIRDAYGYHPFEDAEWGRKFRANLNVLGRYSFTASTPASGALRPLRDPDAPELDEDDGGQNWE